MFRYNGGGVFVIYATPEYNHAGAICGVVLSLALIIAGVVYVFVKKRGAN